MRDAAFVLVFALAFVAAILPAQSGYVVQVIGNPDHPNADFGSRIVVVGDVDGDGRTDYLVSDPQAFLWPNSQAVVGEVRLVSGATGATIRIHNGTYPSYTIYGIPYGAVTYTVFSGAGDLDLDGVPDYALGAPGYSVPPVTGYYPTVVGLLRVFSGATGAVLYYLTGSATSPVGMALGGPGDITGDGVPDLVIGWPYTPGFGILSGIGGPSFFVSGAPSSGLGSAFCGPGDLNGDGISDLVVGANGGSGFVQAISGVTGLTLWTFNGTAAQSGFGTVLAAAGDVNGDGVNDVIAGAPTETVAGLTNAGRAYVISGATGSLLFAIAGATAGEKLGAEVSKAGDLNGDGFGDVLVSSPAATASGPSAGMVRLVYGPGGTSVQILATGGASDSLGSGLAGGVFLDGDPIPDVLVGAPEVPGSGRVTAFSGASLTSLYQVLGGPVPFGQGRLTSAVDAGDQDGDGIPDLALGMRSYFLPGTFVGGAWIVSGTTGQIIRMLPGPVATNAGDGRSIVTRLGDIDADGYQDFAMAAALGNWGPNTDTVKLDVVSGLTGAQIHTHSWTGCIYQAVHMVAPADYDGDGIRDVVVALPAAAASGGNSCGAPVFGSVEARSGATGALIGAYTSPTPGDGFGRSLDTLGDVTGDGIADVVVGGTAVVRVLAGPSFTTSVFSIPTGGGAVAGVGDVSGDGIPDFAAAAPVTYLNNYLPVPVQIFSGAGGALLATIPVPAGSGQGFGSIVANVGDLDGDGVCEIGVGGAWSTALPGGIVYVFSGASGSLLFTAQSTTQSEGFGYTLARVGDRNQDGLEDAFIAAGSTFVSKARIISFAGVPVGSQAIGSGCTLASGRKPSLAAFGGDPTSSTGNPAFGLIVSNGGPGALGALAAGASTTSWAGTPLPLSLSPGLPGCSLYVSVDNLIPFTLGAGSGGLGAAKFPFPIPVMPALAGATLSVQAYVADSAAVALPGAVTRGLTVTVQ